MAAFTKFVTFTDMKTKGVRSYNQHKVTNDYDAILIGSGISCLTCGAILAREGKRVLILEQHYTAGGFTHAFKRSGYEWDVGIHYIGGVGHDSSTLARLFRYISDGNLAWADMGPVYDRIIFGEEVFDLPKGPKALANQLKTYFPDDVDRRAIDQYLDLVRQVGKTSRMYFAEKALAPAVAAQIGAEMRAPFLRFAGQTTREVMEELTDNERLIGVLTAQYGDYGLPPAQSSFAMQALVAGHYFFGGAYPIGGAGQIVATVAPVIAAAGGLILTNAPVAEIVIEAGRARAVRMEDGRLLTAPLVISGAGVRNTFGRLLPAGVAGAGGLKDPADQVQPSVSHLGLYLGFRRSASELGLGRANYWIYPAGKYDHDANVAAFLADPEAPFPVVYVSFPSAKDPTWDDRYPGRATVEVITLAPYSWFAPWADTQWGRRGSKYEALKEKLSRRLLEVLYQYEPQLRGQVDHYELSTPLSTQKFANYSQGEIYGIQHDPGRFQQAFLRPHTSIKGLFLTGQDITTAGIGGALMSGVLTISALRGEDYLSKILAAVEPAA